MQQPSRALRGFPGAAAYTAADAVAYIAKPESRVLELDACERTDADAFAHAFCRKVLPGTGC